MEIDPDISNWIWEFLLRQSLDDRALNSLLVTLPLPSNNLDFQKLLLLNKIESQLSHNSINQSLLVLLEKLEEIEFQRGLATVSDSMKHAYCAVAVECTLNHLQGNDDKESNREFKFFEAVKKVWRGRIHRMGNGLNNGGLGSEELWRWEDELQAAVWDNSVCERVMKKCKEVNAVEAVRVYLREEREKMGPSFLELVALRVKDDNKFMQEMLATRRDRLARGKGRLCDVGRGAKGDNPKQVRKETARPMKKLFPSETSRGMQIADSEKVPPGASQNNYNLVHGADVSDVRKGLEPSLMEQQALVKYSESAKDDTMMGEMHRAGNNDQVAGNKAALRDVGQDMKSNNCEQGHNGTGKKAILCSAVGNSSNGNEVRKGTGKDTSLCDVRRDKQGDKCEEVNGENVLPRNKLAGSKRPRGVKIVDSEETHSGPLDKNYNEVHSAEVDKVREALDSSSRELKDIVNDPLPEALELAEAIHRVIRKRKGHDPAKEPGAETNTYILDHAGVVQDTRCNASEVPKKSLMEKNSSAHTYEWDESIDSSQEDLSNYPDKPKLPRSRRTLVSPIQKRETVKGRRKTQAWSVEEEDALREGVEKYGKGRWKLILTAYRDVFEDRIDNDLRDKWRNMVRSGKVKV